MLTGNYLGASTSGQWAESTLMVILALCLLITWLTSAYKLWQLTFKAKGQDVEAMPELSLKQRMALTCASLTTGLICGTIGVGGAIFLLPLLMYGLKIPVRFAVGSTAALVFLGSVAAVFGKAQAGLIPFDWSIVITLAALAGGCLGGKTHTWFSPIKLRVLHLALVAVALSTTLISFWNAYY